MCRISFEMVLDPALKKVHIRLSVSLALRCNPRTKIPKVYTVMN
jgi:hypothetical protein